MYNVRYSQSGVGSPYRPVVFDSVNIEDAVQFALNLHRSSNVNHVVTVCQESDEPKIFREILFLELRDLPFSPVVDGQA